jgi:hypothetical protein
MATRSIPVNLAFYATGERVSDLKRRIVTTVPATTERDLLDDLLRLVNARGSELAGVIDGAVAAAARSDAVLAGFVTPATILADYTRETAPLLQQWAAGELAKIASGRGAFERFDIASPGITDGSEVDGPIVIESIMGMPRSPTTERRFAFASLGTYVQWSVLLLREQQRAKQVELCRCRLDECGKFFFAIDSGGRTRRTFCSEDHMQDHHRKSSAERVARSRANRRKAG